MRPSRLQRFFVSVTRCMLCPVQDVEEPESWSLRQQIGMAGQSAKRPLKTSLPLAWPATTLGVQWWQSPMTLLPKELKA